MLHKNEKVLAIFIFGGYNPYGRLPFPIYMGMEASREKEARMIESWMEYE